jgi:hypothetical protein
MIVSLGKVKTLLNITDGDNDSQITALIPQVEADYEHIRGKPFDKGSILSIETSGLPADEEITITIGNFASIGGTDSGWEHDVDLRENDTADIIATRIINQIQPQAYYLMTLSSASTDVADVNLMDRFPTRMENYSVIDLTVTSSTSITSTIAKMQTLYPKGAELTAAQMINYQLSKPSGVKAEHLGDYSVTYDDASGGYPKSITAGIKRFAVML